MDLQDTGPHTTALDCDIGSGPWQWADKETRNQGCWVVDYVNVEVTENDGRSWDKEDR